MKNSILLYIFMLLFTIPSFAFYDYYIDRVTGKQLGKDGSNSNKIRVIDIREWNYVIEDKGGVNTTEGIWELHKNSYVISIDEYQIQKEIQKVADDTRKEGLENQVFIVLNVNTGRVFALRDWKPESKTNKKIVINTYRIAYGSAPRVDEGLMLLAQIHGHPKEIRAHQKNVKSVSNIDRNAAKKLGITIFAIDTFVKFKYRNHYEHSINFDMHMVTKNGSVKRFVSQTFGKNGFNTFNFSAYFELMLRNDQYAPQIL